MANRAFHLAMAQAPSIKDLLIKTWPTRAVEHQVDEDFDEFRADELNDFHGVDAMDEERDHKDAGHVW